MHDDPAYDRILQAMQAVEAPHGLRERVAAERERTLVRRMVVKRIKLTGVLAGVAAALGIVVGLASSGGGAAAPSPLEAAALATRGAVAAAPAVSPTDPQRLQAQVADVVFPAWSGRFPWKASGRRSDTLGGRSTVTVYYDGPRRERLGYTSVDGEALAWPDGARTVTRNGVQVRVTRRDGRVMAFWREHGHTCVISAPDTVPADRLVTLAAADYVS
jgi:hypothetical protein